jgi:CBS domain-containing protein
MTRDLTTVCESTPVRDLLELFSAHGRRHLPVVASECVVGMISRCDVLRVLHHAPERMVGGARLKNWWSRIFGGLTALRAADAK